MTSEAQTYPLVPGSITCVDRPSGFRFGVVGKDIWHLCCKQPFDYARESEAKSTEKNTALQEHRSGDSLPLVVSNAEPEASLLSSMGAM
jgi:hypothetical protein